MSGSRRGGLHQAVRVHPVLPGPGLGGHCIPVDPHYLSWKLKTLNYRARFIELAGEINAEMPDYVVGKACRRPRSTRIARALTALLEPVQRVRDFPHHVIRISALISPASSMNRAR